MRIALLCEEAAGARVLEALAKSPHELAAVLTSEGSAVWRMACKLGHSPVPARRVREPAFAAELAASAPALILNVHSLYIVPPAVLQVPPLGAYNLHPGPLPGCAGLNAPSWAIYHGWQRHGVTVHRMEPGIDTGAIAYQEHFPIHANDTGLSVALRCAAKGVSLIQKLLENIERIPQIPQDLSQRRYFGRGVPQGGRIDWNAPARRIHDFVRACDYQPFASPWGTPEALLENAPVAVHKTALTGERCDAPPGTLKGDLVATADEWLRLQKVKKGSEQLSSDGGSRISEKLL
jgi:UDP-4-amino-4-deoxy-L-arabinose formyltransferase/UDP-glucuronic acid dehydrogenase (UDP-4-keto-hexauronic acid decarboxylating)